MAVLAASLDVVERWATALPTRYITCRAEFQHNFPEWGYCEDGPRVDTVDEVKTCTRCGVERITTWTDEGDIYARRYRNHGESYLLPRGAGRMSAPANRIVRAERVARMRTRRLVHQRQT